MAGVAIGTSHNVCSRLAYWRYARKRRAVMAIDAASHDASVVHHGAREASRTLMASIARHIGRDMVSWFTQCAGAVMASRTRCGNACMAEASGQPSRGAVASVAAHGSLNVRRRFACGAGAVVASRTATCCNASVVK